MNKSIDNYDDGTGDDDGEDAIYQPVSLSPIDQLDGIDDSPLFSHPLFTGQPSTLQQPSPSLP